MSVLAVGKANTQVANLGLYVANPGIKLSNSISVFNRSGWYRDVAVEAIAPANCNIKFNVKLYDIIYHNLPSSLIME